MVVTVDGAFDLLGLITNGPVVAGPSVSGGTLNFANSGAFITLDHQFGTTLNVATAFNFSGATTVTINNGDQFRLKEGSTMQGAGSVTVAGNGTLIVRGSLQTAGAATVSPGATMQIGIGGTSGDITTAVVNNGSVIFNRSDAYAYGGVISGTGTVTHQGSSVLTLTGTNTYSGGTTVSAGTLAVNGSITSPVTVNSGGALGGIGTINNTVNLNPGGTLAPGLSVGTLNTGSVAFSSGAVLAVEINGTGSDRLNVTGSVSLGGATLSLSLLPGYVHSAGTVYTIVANDLIDPVVGTFSGLAEGATLNVGGNRFKISYVGGTGNDVTLTAIGPATHFSISAPASATAGTAFSFTVTALDQFNNTATGYADTVHFTSSDGAAILPADATLTNGVGTFSATLKTAGNRTITGTDTVTSSITGTSSTILVSAAAATHFTLSAPASATAGTAFSFTVTALDEFNNTATGYAGTVHFTSSDGAATLPADATLTNGVGTFSATLKTAGNRTITATDMVTSSITGTSSNILVSAAAATHFTVSAPASATAGTAFSFTVTALDQFNNTVTGYAGTVHFTSSDGIATLAADATLTNGVGTFSATLSTAGSQTITATDTVTSSITGTSNTVAVSAVTSFSAPSATGTGTITANFTGGGAACTFATAQFIRVTGDPASPPAGTAPPGVAFPHGLFDFTTTGCTPGSTITMTITYPVALAPGTQYWKYGPRPGPIAAGWYVLPATIGATTITFSITDGLLGDDDLLVNGTIVDQGGPGFLITPIPTLSEWMLVLLALMMLSLAIRHLSRRRG